MTWREQVDRVWVPAKRWYDRHSERDRRLIAGVGILVLLSAFFLGVIDPLRMRQQRMADEIAEGLERIERAERLVSALDELQTERDQLKRDLKLARKRLLPGGSGTLGAAALQERANDLASTHGVTVRTAQVMREEPADPFRKVAVRLTLSGELEPLARLLAGLEYDYELVIPFLEFSRRGAAARSRGPRNISATIEVNGFVSGEADVDVADADELPGPPLPPEDRPDFVGPQRPPDEGTTT